MSKSGQEWGPGSGAALAVALLFLGGAAGKSAQLPLQTWLPDAMAGPTPVSALIHAATMVTAGVYLIARTHALFALAPVAMAAVALLGTVTLLLAGFSALTARDIKRILAYSTMSQVGYMFLGLGVGAWSAAVFHFMTHAFFKALLFMGAGAVIVSLHHERDIFRMGGLRKQLPAVFWAFLAGAASLAALPLVTAGFYSKDLILWRAWSSPLGSPWLFVAAAAGAVLTALYTFRMVFIVFFGESKRRVGAVPGALMVGPMAILAVLSIAAGFVETPEGLGHVTLFAGMMHTALPAAEELPGALSDALALQVFTGGGVLLGVLAAYVLFLRRPRWVERLKRLLAGTALYRWFDSGFAFDWLYAAAIAAGAILALAITVLR
jgi:NADH-quinone oxidoreductase subunit L